MPDLRLARASCERMRSPLVNRRTLSMASPPTRAAAESPLSRRCPRPWTAKDLGRETLSGT
eukprot:7804302-Pyramimonas_sp.AAC.1